MVWGGKQMTAAATCSWESALAVRLPDFAFPQHWKFGSPTLTAAQSGGSTCSTARPRLYSKCLREELLPESYPGARMIYRDATRFYLLRSVKRAQKSRFFFATILP